LETISVFLVLPGSSYHCFHLVSYNVVLLQRGDNVPINFGCQTFSPKVQTLPKRRMPFYSAPSSSISPREECSEPVPLKTLLTYPVILSVSNYVTLAFMEIMFISLLPLFMAMPIELGGLGFTPMAIGYVLGTVGIWSGIFSMLFLAKLHRRFGERRVFIVGMLGFSVNFTMLPLINIVAHRTGVTWVVWCLLTFSLSLVPVMDACYSKSQSNGRAVLTERQAVYSFSLRHHPPTKIHSVLRMASRRRQYRLRGPLVLRLQHHSSRSLWKGASSEVMQYISSSFHYLAWYYFLLYNFRLSHGTRTTSKTRFRYIFYRLVDLFVEETSNQVTPTVQSGCL
jgi:hypothetical protein